MTPADKELMKKMFGEILSQEECEARFLFSEKIEPLYTDEEIREFCKRESEYRIKTMYTMDGKEHNIEY